MNMISGTPGWFGPVQERWYPAGRKRYLVQFFTSEGRGATRFDVESLASVESGYENFAGTYNPVLFVPALIQNFVWADGKDEEQFSSEYAEAVPDHDGGAYLEDGALYLNAPYLWGEVRVDDYNAVVFSLDTLAGILEQGERNRQAVVADKSYADLKGWK